MSSPMRIRAALKDGITEVRVLMAHPMETGQRKNAAGDLIPPHFITELVARHRDRIVLRAEFGPSVSTNPYLAFKFRGGAAGEKIVLSWTDNQGGTRTDEAVIA